jgi:hypothetical protein
MAIVAQSARRAAGSAAALTLFGTTTARLVPMVSVAGSRLPAMLASPTWHARLTSMAAAPAAGGSVCGAEEPPAAGGDSKENKENKEAVSYWSVAPTRVVKEDGASWKWSCFRVRAEGYAMRSATPRLELFLYIFCSTCFMCCSFRSS